MNLMIIFNKDYFLEMGIGDWGLGIGDWGLGIGIPNPQSPIPIFVKQLIIFFHINKI